MEFINQHYRQKYAGYFDKTNITGINIENFSKGRIYKPILQAEILQNHEEVKILNQYSRQKYCKFPERRGCFLTKKHSQKHEPTQNDPRKDWKNIRL